MMSILRKENVALLAVALLFSLHGVSEGTARLEALRYNNPGLEVDLGVGLWGIPFPVDFNGDGRHELLVGSGGRPSNGIFRFSGATDDKGPMLFQPGERLSDARTNMQVSHLDDGRWVITQPGFAYPDFKNTFLEERERIPYRPEFYIGRTNQWRYFDYNGNGVLDLIIGASDWREYGWDDAYNDEGEWTNGPLRAHVYWVENLGTDEEPEYGETRIVMAGEESLEVYGMPSPNFADFNGNGLPDIICGEFLDRLTFFENIGTRTEPRYAPGRFLEHEGDVITMDLQMIQPVAIDWDGDGHIDLVVGEEDGRVAFMKNTGEAVDGVPQFLPPVFFRQEADEVKVGALVTPFAYDWNGNGRLDLITGNTAGYIALVENLGGYPPRWAAPHYLEADGEVIRILAGENGSIQGPAEAKWGYTVLSVADWNNNGLPDLIVNSIWGKVVWFENIGTRTEAKLAGAKPIEVEWEGEAPKPAWNWWDPEGKELATQWRSSVQAIDLNGNGLQDLVALDQDGFLSFYERREIDGELKLLPPRRIFRVEEDAPAVFDHSHRPVEFPDDQGRNRLAHLDEEGRLAFYGWVTIDGRRQYGIVQRVAPHSATPEEEADAIGQPLRLTGGWAGRSGRRKFVLVDWTGNGRLDLLVNSVNTTLMENIAEEPGQFLFRERGPIDDTILAGHTTNPAIVDWNGDGLPDVVVGAEDGLFYYMRNPRSKNDQ